MTTILLLPTDLSTAWHSTGKFLWLVGTANKPMYFVDQILLEQASILSDDSRMRLLLLDQTRDCSTHSSPSLAIYAGRLYEEIGINVEALIEAGSYGAHLEATCSSPFGQEGILGIKLSRQDSGLLSLDISEADIRLRRKAQTFLESLHGNAYSEREAQSPIPTTWEGALQAWG